MRRAALLGVLLASLLGSGLLAGCLGEETPTVRVTPYLRVLEAAPGRSVPLAVHVQSLDAFKQDVAVDVQGLPPGWSANATTPRLDLPGRATTAVVVHLALPSDAQYGAHDVRVRVGSGSATLTLDVRDPAGAPTAPGDGVRLEYVVWAANGSILQSNAPALRNQTAIPVGDANATWLGLPPATNATLVAHLPGPNATEAPEGRVALPPAWAEALLGQPPGAIAWVRMEDAPADVAPAGALLRVLDVVDAAPAPAA